MNETSTGDRKETPRPLCVITPEMIEAGVAELREKTLGEPLSRLVEDVFLAMWIVEYNHELGDG